MAFTQWVKQTAQSALPSGISATEAQSIFDAAVPGRYTNQGRTQKPTTAQKGHLVKLTEIYSPFFTSAGAKKWEKLTGVQLTAAGTPSYQGLVQGQTLVDLRAKVAKEAKEVQGRYTISRSGGKVVVKPKPLTAAEAAKALGKPKYGQFYKIRAGSKSWVFTDKKLAATCLSTLSKRTTQPTVDKSFNRPNTGYQHMWDQKGPRYR